MVSKVAQKKAEMVYVSKPVWPICANCLHYTSEKEIRGSWCRYEVEVRKRCTLGGFAVKKSATCKRHEFAE